MDKISCIGIEAADVRHNAEQIVKGVLYYYKNNPSSKLSIREVINAIMADAETNSDIDMNVLKLGAFTALNSLHDFVANPEPKNIKQLFPRSNDNEIQNHLSRETDEIKKYEVIRKDVSSQSRFKGIELNKFTNYVKGTDKLPSSNNSQKTQLGNKDEDTQAEAELQKAITNQVLEAARKALAESEAQGDTAPNLAEREANREAVSGTQPIATEETLVVDEEIEEPTEPTEEVINDDKINADTEQARVIAIIESEDQIGDKGLETSTLEELNEVVEIDNLLNNDSLIEGLFEQFGNGPISLQTFNLLLNTIDPITNTGKKYNTKFELIKDFIKYLVYNPNIIAKVTSTGFEFKFDLVSTSRDPNSVTIPLMVTINHDKINTENSTTVTVEDRQAQTTTNLTLDEFFDKYGNRKFRYQLPATEKLNKKEDLALNGRGLAYTNTIDPKNKTVSMLGTTKQSSALKFIFKLKNAIMQNILTRIKLDTFKNKDAKNNPIADTKYFKKVINSLLYELESVEDELPKGSEAKIYFETDTTVYPNDPTVESEYQIKYRNSTNDTIIYKPKRLKIKIEIVDADGNIVNLTLNNSDIPLSFDLSNLDVPVSVGEVQAYDTYAARYAELQKAVEESERSGERYSIEGITFNGKEAQKAKKVKAVYQPVQYYNSDEDTIQQYRFHYNENYRLGDKSQNLTEEELIEVLNNPIVLKGIGYDYGMYVAPITDTTSMSDANSTINNKLTSLNTATAEPNSITWLRRELATGTPESKQRVKAELLERIKQPINLPLGIYSFIMHELGFTTNELINAQSYIDEENNRTYSGRPMIGYTVNPQSSDSADGTGEAAYFQSNKSEKLANDYDSSLSFPKRVSLTFSDFLKKANDILSSVDNGKYKIFHEVFNYAQSPYLVHQLLEYIQHIENNTDGSNETLVTSLKDLKAYLFNPEDNYDVLDEYHQDELKITKDMSKDEIILALRNRAELLLTTISSDAAFKKLVSESNHGVEFVKRSNVKVTEKVISKEVQNKNTPNAFSEVSIELPNGKQFQAIKMVGQKPSFYYVPVTAIDINESSLEAFRTSGRLNTDANGNEYVAITKASHKSTLFKKWYSIDGKHEYMGATLANNGGTVTISSGYSQEYINYTESKYQEFIQLESTEDKLNVVNSISQRSFGGVKDLTVDFDGNIKTKKNDLVSDRKRTQTIVEKAPHLVGTKKYGQVIEKIERYKAIRGGFRSPILLNFFNVVNTEASQVVADLDTNKDLNKVSVEFNPVVGNSGSGGQVYTSTSNLRHLDSLAYLTTNAYPMFPHLVIDLNLNEDNFKLAAIPTKEIESATVTIIEETPIESESRTVTLLEETDEKETEITVEVPIESVSESELDTFMDEFGDKFGDMDEFGFGKAATSDIIDYSSNKDEITAIYKAMLGISPIFITQDKFNKLTRDEKNSNFYVIESKSKFFIPSKTNSGQGEISGYVGYAIKGANALFAPDGKFSNLVAKHEILHTILNEYMPRNRRDSILATTRRVMKKDTKFKAKTRLLSDIEVEEYLVLKLESLNTLNSLSASNDTKTYIDNSITGKFFNNILGKDNVVSRFMYWISDIFKNSKTIVNNFKTVGVTSSFVLGKLIFDLSFNRFAGQSGRYNNFNEAGEYNEKDIRGRLDQEEAIRIGKVIKESFENPLVPTEDKFNRALEAFDNSIKGIKDATIRTQFINSPIEIYKQRMTIPQLVSKLEQDYIKKTLVGIISNRTKFGLGALVKTKSFVTLLKVSKGEIAFDNYLEAQDFYTNLKSEFIEAFDTLEDFESSRVFNHIFIALTLLANKKEVFSTVFDEVDFESWLDTEASENDTEEITNQKDWYNRDASHLSTFDTLSKKVQNYVYNTSYKIGDEIRYIDQQSIQSILVGIFQRAHSLDEKGKNKRMESLYQAFEDYLNDLSAQPNSYAYLEARAIYDKVFRLDDSIPVAKDSDYSSNYAYSYAEIAFNNNELIESKPLAKNNKELNNLFDILEAKLEANDVNLDSTISTINKAIDTTLKVLEFKLNINVSTLKELGKTYAESNDPNDLLDYLQIIREELETVSSKVNFSTLHLHQDAFNAVTSLYYSNWRVDFIKASVNKNGVREHKLHGPGQSTKSRLATSTSIINTTMFNQVINEDTVNNLLQSALSSKTGFSLVDINGGITITIPITPVTSHTKNDPSNIARITINQNDIQKAATSVNTSIKESALNTIIDNLGNDFVPVMSNFLAAIGSNISHAAVRAYVVSAEGNADTEVGAQEKRQLLEYVLTAYTLIAANYQESLGGLQPTISKFVSSKKDTAVQSIVDKSGKQTSNLNTGADESTDPTEAKIYSPTRDREGVLERLINFNKNFRQSVEKTAFHTLDGRHASDKPTTPLYEHLDKLKLSIGSTLFKQLEAIRNGLRSGDFNKNEAIKLKNKVLNKYKFMHSSLYLNKLFNVKLFAKEALSRDREVKDFAAFNYITNTSSGKGKSFLNLTPKEVMRQFINDFFLYAGTNETGANNKFGNYRLVKSSSYKQNLEPQAARGSLPMVEIADKVFYDYEGRDKALGLDLFGMGYKYESELFNVHSNAVNYANTILSEIKSIVNNSKNANLGMYINTHYLDLLLKDLEANTLSSESTLGDVLKSYNTLVNEINDDTGKDLTKVTNRILAVTARLSSDLLSTTNEVTKSKIQEELSRYNALLDNKSELDKLVDQDNDIVKKLINARLKEAKHIVLTINNSNGFGDSFDAPGNKLKELYTILSNNSGVASAELISNEVRAKYLEYSTDAAAKFVYEYVAAPTETRLNRINSELLATIDKYNLDVSNLDKKAKNKLTGQLTAHRHYDKNTKLFKLNGKTYYSLDSALNSLSVEDKVLVEDFEKLKKGFSFKDGKTGEVLELSIEDITKLSNRQSTKHTNHFEALIKTAGLDKYLVGQTLSPVESIKFLHNHLQNATKLNKVETTKVNAISPLLYEDMTTSFKSYTDTIKYEMVRFAKLAIENEVTIDGLHAVKVFNPKEGKVSRVKLTEYNNNRYASAILPFAGAKVISIDPEGNLEEVANPIGSQLDTSVPGRASKKKFIYYKDNSNVGNDFEGEEIERMYIGSDVFFGEDGLGMDTFNTFPIDEQLKAINPIALDYYATNSINGFYLGQFIDGDIYRYKGRDTTSKVKDLVKRIGTNTTPGTRAVNREVIRKGNKTIIINDDALSTHHNVANLPDEAYDIYEQQYKYFLDIYADTYTNEEALEAIADNLKAYGNIDEIVKLKENSLQTLLDSDVNSEGKIYKRKNVRYKIDKVGGEYIVSIDENYKGIILGKSGEDIENFDAWDGVTFTSNLFRLLTMNSFGNQEGIDMTQQGYKMILNNLDEKNQNGISMKSLQVGLTANFTYDSEDSVKVMVKEGYSTGILNEEFEREHTYSIGTEAIINGVATRTTQAYTVNVKEGSWSANGKFIAPELNIVVDTDNNITSVNMPSRNKNLYDTYWENGGWNPKADGTFDYVYFNGTTEPATDDSLGTKISKSDFEVFKAYIENRRANNFMVRDLNTGTLVTVESLLEEANSGNLSGDIDMDTDEDGNTIPVDANQLMNKILESDRFVYMDSVMLFNPGTGTKKGARTSNPDFKGKYSDTFENIHTQSLESLAYIITINKKDKVNQDVALSSQFTYLAGMENNYLEAQKAYDMIAKLSKVERENYTKGIDSLKEDMKTNGILEKATSYFTALNNDPNLLLQLSQTDINILQSDYDMNPEDKSNPYIIFSNNNANGITLSDEQVELLSTRFLDKLAVKQHIFGIIKNSAESKKEFDDTWDYVATGYADPTSLSLSNPILFNKIFSEVAAIMSKAMALRVNGKKAVQMPISQMKQYYEIRDPKYAGKVYSKLDLLRHELMLRGTDASVTEDSADISDITDSINRKIKTGLYTKRNLKYGAPQNGVITQTEVEASNPLAATYTFLKGKTIREVFDINSTLTFESTTFQDIGKVVNLAKENTTQVVLSSNEALRRNITESSFYLVLKEELQGKIKRLEDSEKLAKLKSDKNLGEDSQLIADDKNSRIESAQEEIQNLNLELLEEDKTTAEKAIILDAIAKVESRIENIKQSTSTEITTDPNKLAKYKEELRFLELLESSTDQELVSSEYVQQFNKFSKDYASKVQLVNKSIYGIMSRVPNTGLNSNSFFKIISFNNEYGNSIFTPAEWLNISGSDHDGDTLQLWQYDPTGRNRPSDNALDVFSSIMTNGMNAEAIFAKLDLSLIPIHDKANVKYKQHGMYLKPYDPWSFFTVLSQNAVGTNVVGSSALLGKNYTYTNQVVKRIEDFVAIQNVISGSEVATQISDQSTIATLMSIEENNESNELSDALSQMSKVVVIGSGEEKYVPNANLRDIDGELNLVETDEATGNDTYTPVRVVTAQLTKEQRKDLIFTHNGKSIETEFPLTTGQKEALKELIDFTLSPLGLDDGSRIRTLQGPAGTGKTAIIGYLKKYLGSNMGVAYAAPTHAATIELAFATVKTGNRQFPFTIRSSYRWSDRDESFMFARKVRFRGRIPVYVVDEASMIDPKELGELDEAAAVAGVKLIYVGDAKQIPYIGAIDKDGTPVEVESKQTSDVFSKYKQINLTEIKRQADLGTLDFLSEVRDSKEYLIPKVDPNSVLGNKIAQSTIDNQLNYINKFMKNELEDSIILSYTNRGVMNSNQQARKALGFSGVPKIGESIIGYGGYYNKQIEDSDIANSVKYQIAKIEKVGSYMEITATSKKLGKLIELGFDLEDEAVGNYYQLSRKDAFDFPELTDEDFETNNAEVSEIMSNIHMVHSQAIAKIIPWSAATPMLEALSLKLKNINLGDDYIYNPALGRMVKYNYDAHRDITPQSGIGSLKILKGVDYGYAMTIHKSQGSTYKNVIYQADSTAKGPKTKILGKDNEFITTERQAMNYVALSRTSDNLVILGSSNIFTNTSEEFDKELIQELVNEPKGMIQALQEVGYTLEDITTLLEQSTLTAEEQGDLILKYCK